MKVIPRAKNSEKYMQNEDGGPTDCCPLPTAEVCGTQQPRPCGRESITAKFTVVAIGRRLIYICIDILIIYLDIFIYIDIYIDRLLEGSISGSKNCV